MDKFKLIQSSGIFLPSSANKQFNLDHFAPSGCRAEVFLFRLFTHRNRGCEDAQSPKAGVQPPRHDKSNPAQSSHSSRNSHITKIFSRGQLHIFLCGSTLALALTWRSSIRSFSHFGEQTVSRTRPIIKKLKLWIYITIISLNQILLNVLNSSLSPVAAGLLVLSLINLNFA